MTVPAGPSAYALLTDGTIVEIRPARPDDFDAVRDMHAKMSRRTCTCAAGHAAAGSRLAEDLPQIAELELSLVVARPDGAVAVTSLVRVQPAEPTDSYLRRPR